MKAVGNIQRITKTMQMIATARFQAIQRRATAAQPFTEKITELVRDVSAAGGGFSNPLLAKRETLAGPELMLVITSDRGLCGGYNANILRTARQAMKEADAPVEIEVAGKKGAGYFKFHRLDVLKLHTQFGDKPAYEDVETLADDYIRRFMVGDYAAIRVAYMHFESMSIQSPRVEQLLPMSPPEKAEGNAVGEAGQEQKPLPYDFSPSSRELLDELLPMAVKTRLFQCFNEGAVSEQLARMVAMKAATDAAGKMKKSLSREYNRARQAAITTELSEIISGAAALD